MPRDLDDLSRTLADDQQEERSPRRGFLGRALAVLAGGAALTASGSSVASAHQRRCPPGLVGCQGECRDPHIDPDHCGGCGIVCTEGNVCRNGECVPC